MISCLLILVLSPVLFGAALPAHLPRFFLALAIYTAASLSLGCVLGLAVNSQAKLTMVSQLLFLPSILLSGIMFPAALLPDFLEAAGHIFPAFWGYRLMLDKGFLPENLWYLILLLFLSLGACAVLLKKKAVS